MAQLEVNGLTKRYRRHDLPAVQAVDFSVAENEIFVLLGPSGCGKTTTLRLIAGFESADAGEIRLGGRVLQGRGRAVPPEQRGIGLVPQNLALFPHLSVLGNVTFGLHRLPRREAHARAREALALMGIAGLAGRRPHELSGGQQQRVAIARSLAPKPRLILLDEPFGNLDEYVRQRIRDELRVLLKEQGIAALMVTHDQEEALSFADRLAVMNEGVLHQIGTPQAVYLRPADSFVARFLGGSNLIEGEGGGRCADTVLGTLQLDRPVEGPALLSIRPEHLRIGAPEAGCPQGRIERREYKGHDLTLHVKLNGRSVVVQTPYDCPFGVGDRVSISHAEPATVLEEGRPAPS